MHTTGCVLALIDSILKGYDRDAQQTDILTPDRPYLPYMTVFTSNCVNVWTYGAVPAGLQLPGP